MLNTFELKKIYTPGLHIAHCSFLHCSPGHNKGWRTNTSHLLRYVVSGTGKYHTKTNVYSLKPGDLFISHPGQPGLFTADQSDYVDLFLINLQCENPYASLLQKDVIHVPALAPVFEKLMPCQLMPSREWAVYGIVSQIFAHLAQLKIEPSNTSDLIADALQMIRSNYNRNIRVEDVAAALGMSRSYFYRLFRERMGFSPQTYILRCRIANAKRLLKDSDLSIAEISQQIGYDDICTFSRMFKRLTDMSPSQFRAEYKGKL